MNKLTIIGPFLHQALFAKDAPENALLSFRAKSVLLVLAFVATRLITLWGFEVRHVDWLHADPIYVADSAGFVATANYVAQHGVMPTEDQPQYRQFAGLSLLMIIPNLAIHNMVWSGYFVVMMSAVLCLILIQYLFDDFRLSLISCVFLPYCITTTCTIYAEAPTMLCFLVGLWVLRDFQERPGILCLGLFISGYCLVLRQSAGFFVIPFLFVLARQGPGGSTLGAIKMTAVALLPIMLYLLWSWLTIHQLFPQLKLHREAFLEELRVTHTHGRYSTTMFDFPFRSLFAGLTDPHERLGKRLSILFTVVVVFAAFGMLCWAVRREGMNARGALALAFAVALGVHMIFHFSLGGVFGYKWLDRHFSQLNPIIDWALFYRRNLRWPWIALMAGAGVIFAIGTGPGTHYLFFK